MSEHLVCVYAQCHSRRLPSYSQKHTYTHEQANAVCQSAVIDKCQKPLRDNRLVTNVPIHF